VVVLPDAVADEAADDREAGVLDDRLDCGGDVADPRSDLGSLDSGP